MDPNEWGEVETHINGGGKHNTFKQEVSSVNPEVISELVTYIGMFVMEVTEVM